MILNSGYLIKGIPDVLLDFLREMCGYKGHLKAVRVGWPVAVVTNRPVNNLLVANVPRIEYLKINAK